jgi:hypothetical protein
MTNREKILKLLEEYSNEYLDELVKDEDRLNVMLNRLYKCADEGDVDSILRLALLVGLSEDNLKSK